MCNTRRTAMILGAIGLAAVFPSAIMAQTPDMPAGKGDNSDVSTMKIDLDLESTNLFYGLKLLFSQIKANFTIDESLKSLTVTAHLRQVPFRTALETLLKSTGTPLTYRVESGIYSVVPKVESPPAEPGMPEPPFEPRTGGGYKYGVIRPANLSAMDLALAFGGTVVITGYNSSSLTQFGAGGLSGGSGSGFSNSGFGNSGFGNGGLGSGGFGSSGLGSGSSGFGGRSGGRGF